jgi:hypothetical protein
VSARRSFEKSYSRDPGPKDRTENIATIVTMTDTTVIAIGALAMRKAAAAAGERSRRRARGAREGLLSTQRTSGGMSNCAAPHDTIIPTPPMIPNWRNP